MLGDFYGLHQSFKPPYLVFLNARVSWQEKKISKI